jgi:hypothetical protein
MLRQTLYFSLHDEVEDRPRTPKNSRDMIDTPNDQISTNVDEEKLKDLWRKGKEAWAGISSPTEWVEQLRDS